MLLTKTLYVSIKKTNYPMKPINLLKKEKLNIELSNKHQLSRSKPARSMKVCDNTKLKQSRQTFQSAYKII
jgi:hypothetical protein